MKFSGCRFRRRALAAVALSLAGFASAQSNEAWPTKSITLVSPYPAGGITDVCGNPTAATLRWRFSTGQEIDGDFPEAR